VVSVVVAVVVAVVALGACTSGSKTGPATTTAAVVTTATSDGAVATTIDPAAAMTVLSGADLADPATLDAVSAMASEPAALATATALLTARALPPRPARWAATYVYSLYGKDPAPLRRLLTDDTPGVALMAAGGLVALGDAAGFPVLIDALTDEGHMPGWDVPLRKWQYASFVLVSSTAISDYGPPNDAEATRLAAAQAKWKTWLSTSQPSLHFDAVAQRWVPA
jgi:hypothetical protein